MIKKRFTLSQNGTLHTVRDNVENKPLGVFEFKDNEFPAYACFHVIIDLMNDLFDDNEELQERNERQAETIRELYNLIKNKDWETLTAHIGELKKAEEQLQREWQTYGG